MSRRRVVVTGMGMLSPLGADVPSTWQGILAGRSGIGLIEHTDLSAYSTRFGGSVQGFNVEDYLSVKEARKLDLFIQYGLAAGFQAVRNSGLEVTDANRERIGVAMGSGIGGLTNIEETSRTLHEQGPRRISPFFVPGSIINMISGFLSIHLGTQGPNYAIATACTTGTHCIGMAARNIAYGEADVMIAGGAEMAACGLGMGGFGASRALSTRNDDPTRASRPWDKGRDGFVLSDGAGALVLEELEHAKARGATIYGEIVGFATNCDAAHITQPQSETMQYCMEQSLKIAGLSAQDIGYISAHGTATDRGDMAESLATATIYGDNVPLSSLKSYFGHTLGACGALEAWMSLQMMREGWFAPTLNLNKPDPNCGALDYIMHEARKVDCEFLQSNNFAFGGINTSIIIKRWP